MGRVNQAPANTAARSQRPVEALTASKLASASVEDQKQMIGERLFPLIHSRHVNQASKITGMLLEMDNSELLHLLEDPQALILKENEAIRVLEEHNKGNR